MRRRFGLPCLLAAALAFAAACFAAEPEIEFVGVVSGGKEQRLVLRSGTGEPQWVTVGGQFAGYTVTAYEPKEETAVLTKDGRQLRLRLRDAKVTPGGSGLTPEVREAILKNMRMLAAAAEQLHVDTGKTVFTYDEVIAPNYLREPPKPQAGENYRAIQFVRGKTMEVTTASGDVIRFIP